MIRSGDGREPLQRESCLRPGALGGSSYASAKTWEGR